MKKVRAAQRKKRHKGKELLTQSVLNDSIKTKQQKYYETQRDAHDSLVYKLLNKMNERNYGHGRNRK